MINSKQFLFIFALILFLFGLTQTHQAYSSSSNVLKDSYSWELAQTITSPDSSTTFGFSVSLSPTISVIGDPSKAKVLIYQLEDGNWNYFQTLIESGYPSYGWSVAVSQDGLTTATGSPDNTCFFPYYYDGSNYVYGWLPEEDSDPEIISEGLKGAFTFGSNMAISTYVKTQFVGASDFNFIRIVFGPYEYFDLNGASGEGLGWAVDISENPFVAVASCLSVKKVYIYSVSRSTGFTYISDITSTLDGFGNDVAISNDGNVVVVAAMESNTVVIYRRSGNNWNEEKVLSVDSSNFGSSVSISEDGNRVVVGANLTDEVYIYSYSESDWNEEYVLSGATSFGTDVSISGDILLVSAPQSGEVSYFNKTYIPPTPPFVELIDCSSGYSEFECYWNQPENNVSLYFQIGYGSGCIQIINPVFDSSENVFYQEFNSSIYPGIYGNKEYSIQLQACNLTEDECGSPSESITLKTMIDGVEDFELIGLSDSINVSWNPPNVEIIEDVPHLDHYVIGYFCENMEIPEYLDVDNTLTSYQITGLESGNECEVAMWGCRTPSCSGDDEGESVVSNVLDIDCSWLAPEGSQSPSYYNITYKSYSFEDEEEYQTTQLYQNFTVKLPNQYYQINVSACSSNGVCGIISSKTIRIAEIPHPNIIESISEIEQIKLNFSQVSQAKSYLVSIDNHLTWINFTTLIPNENEMIGTINELSGNVDYYISVRGCTDTSCEPQYLGDQSSTITIKPKLGNITGLNCNPTICGFECEWNGLELSSGLEKYSFTYNSESICLDKSLTSYSISDLLGGENYEISIFASADLNCSFNEYSGLSSSTSVTTDELPAPSNVQSYSEIEQIKLTFSQVSQAKSYLVSIDNQLTWINFTTLISNGNEMIGTINELSGNVDYYISVRGCTDTSWNITGLNCNPTICGFECEWNGLELSNGLRGYSLSYNSESICLDKSLTSYSVPDLIGGENYEISIFASADLNCSFNEYSGLSSSTSVTTNMLPAPSNVQSYSEIEQIKLTFSQVSEAKSYLVSIDGKMSWINFTTLISNGNEMIGTINELSGNVDYYISVRGCIDTSCTVEYAGYPSSTITNKPKLGNITGLNCNPTICGFECEWNGLELSNGLRGYSLSYNSESICLAKSLTKFSIFNLIGGENYEISIFASADWRCETNQYSGLSSSTSITTIPSPTEEANDSSTDTKVVIPAVLVPIIVVAIIIVVIIWLRKRSKKSKNKNQNQNKEIELSDDV
ncbi:hypothetical protein M0811_09248 [Anaeramoeba ignava]|uniref:Fibronectin type-III domain-containing protein n=1 Tax=Anaeramoeba ignava TaxID=1746090 RepID=A0A9Q0LHA2_ANAIG|nr:hypothetical protein M0811_09248 [Anaeramoeba ignava]